MKFYINKRSDNIYITFENSFDVWFIPDKSRIWKKSTYTRDYIDTYVPNNFQQIEPTEFLLRKGLELALCL